MNLNIELHLKLSDFRLNLLIVKKYNTCYVSFSSICVFVTQVKENGML